VHRARLTPDGHAAATAAWFASRPGQKAGAALCTKLQPLLRPGGRLLVIGAPRALLAGLRIGELERTAAVGCAGGWPSSTASTALVADPAQLPFHAAVFDQALVVVASCVDAKPAMLRELWRVLAPAGELLLIEPEWLLEASVSTAAEARLGNAMFGLRSVTRLRIPLPPPRAFTARLLPIGTMVLMRAEKCDGLAPVGPRRRANPALAQAASGRLRRRAATPTMPKPVTSSAQVDGSGSCASVITAVERPNARSSISNAGLA